MNALAAHPPAPAEGVPAAGFAAALAEVTAPSLNGSTGMAFSIESEHGGGITGL